jgi:hypothetical protein
VSRSTADRSISILRPSHNGDVVESQDDEAMRGSEPIRPRGQATYSDPGRSAVDSSASLLDLVNGMQAACEMLDSSSEGRAVSYTAWTDTSLEDQQYLLDAGARLAQEYSFDWEGGFDGHFLNVRFSSPRQ